MSISLVIPTYNRANLLRETIESALRQKKPFSEIIVVNDGSTDNTLEILAVYSEHITIINSPNCGVQAARNKGVMSANSEYVAFCDSDDLLESNFVEKMSEWINSNPDCKAIYTNIKKFTATSIESDDLSQAPDYFLEGSKLHGDFYYEIPNLYLRLFTIHPFYIAGCTIKKTFFTSIGGFDTKFNRVGAEDGEFTLRVAALVKIAYCRLPLAKVRRHLGNDSADYLHMIVGSAHILEYAISNHHNAKYYETALRSQVSNLRLEAFDRAFCDGRFDLVKSILRENFKRPIKLNFYLKRAITYFPEPIRTLLWKGTQV